LDKYKKPFYWTTTGHKQFVFGGLGFEIRKDKKMTPYGFIRVKEKGCICNNKMVVLTK